MVGNLGIGVDLGASRIRVCAGSMDGKIIRRESRTMTITDEMDEYLAQIVSIVSAFSVKLGPERVHNIVMATPGPLDLKKGTISHSANLPYRDVPVVSGLEDAMGIETYLVNDANAAGLGEWKWGAGRGLDNVFYLTLSTGIGGGAIVDGRLLLGKDGNAAEVGHTTVDISGRLKCGCGSWGHWEAYCSGTGIPNLARSMREDNPRGRRKKNSSLPVGKSGAAGIFARASRREASAVEVVKEVGRLNAIGVANVVDGYDPEIVTIGGGVALHNPEAILRPILKQAQLHAINRVPEVRITPLGDDAGLLGALSASFDPGLIGK